MPPPPPFLVGEKVSLRAYDVEDVDFLMRVRNDPDARLTSWLPLPATRAEMERLAREPAPDAVRFLVEENGSRRPLGILGLYGLGGLHRAADLGIHVVERDDRGKGYGTDAILLALRYAFEELNLNRVGLGVFDFNEDARRLYERLGFVHEGRLREVHHKNGRPVDDLRYSMLAREWVERYGAR